MNYRRIFSFLGFVAIFLGVCMLCCLPWNGTASGANGVSGFRGLGLGSCLSFVVGLVLSLLGRRDDSDRFFRRDAIACVSLSWILAILLSATPYFFGGVERLPGVRMSFVDALFESSSGLTTTGATVFGELEQTSCLPRGILLWRNMTHFLGGLGVMCFFVALLGQGAHGKAVMKLEHFMSGNAPVSKIRAQAFSLFLIYIGLNVVCFLLLFLMGMTPFDALAHSFSVVALGGFSTHNMSVGYFATDPSVNALGVEIVLVLFMILGATNYWTLYWVFLGKPGKLLGDSEWKTFIGLTVVGTIIATGYGLVHGDFHNAPCVEQSVISVVPPSSANGTLEDLNSTEEETSESESTLSVDEEKAPSFWTKFGRSLRFSCFHVFSLSTGAGFATERYELWNATSLTIFLVLMFIGGCSGSTAGGVKIFRVVLTYKTVSQYVEHLYNPNVVRVNRIDGENITPESANAAVAYLVAFTVLIVLTTLLVVSLEPNTIWELRNMPQTEKLIDLGSGVLAMYSNTGPALGALGGFENYGELSEITKFIFCWAALLGRLEIWTVLSLCSPNFWQNR